MNTAIIVAAGSGNRFGTDRPKQFVEVLGKPIIQYSLETFDACDAIDTVVVVVAAGELDRFRLISKKFSLHKPLTAVSGGKTRSESVSNGLNAASAETTIIAVHDAARPMVTADEIERTIAAAKITGAACLTGAVTDTIKSVSGDRITGTVDRRSLLRALTPQAFRIEILRKALDASELGDDVTDECYLVEKLGVQIASVSGDSRNLKITYPEDLIVFQALIKSESID